MDRATFDKLNRPLVKQVEIHGNSYFIKRIPYSDLGTILQAAPEDKTNCLLALSLCDPDGNRLFADNEAKQLDTYNALVLGDLLYHVMELNGNSPAKIAELKKKSHKTR